MKDNLFCTSYWNYI